MFEVCSLQIVGIIVLKTFRLSEIFTQRNFESVYKTQFRVLELFWWLECFEDSTEHMRSFLEEDI